MRTNSVIHVMLGAMAALGALAASLPVSAASVTLNNKTATASQTVMGTKPSITITGVTVACTIKFSVVSAPGIVVGVVYPIPPPTILVNVVSGSFTSGSPLCPSVKAFSGAAPAANVAANALLGVGPPAAPATAPWPVQVTAVTSPTTVNVGIQNFILYTPALNYCYGTVTGTYNTGTDTLAIPSQTLAHADATGTPDGKQCVINQGVALSVVPVGLISATYP